MKVIVTGGSGFIGTHLSELLLEKGMNVSVLDIAKPRKKDFDYKFHQVDLRNRSRLGSFFKDADVVFHLAANPDVFNSMIDPSQHFTNNVLATYNVLEGVRKQRVTYFVFTSSSTVYGEAHVTPTPETYSPLIPISVYGSTKLACEDLIGGYSRGFEIQSLILRPANIVGSNSTHGVVLDFIRKLRKNSTRLEVLGDGTQRKSYLHISDFVNAVFVAFKQMIDAHAQDEVLNIYNVGNWDTTSVDEIAEIVCEALNLSKVEITYKSDYEGRGWLGDVKYAHLDINRIVAIGWKPSINSNESVRKAALELVHC